MNYKDYNKRLKEMGLNPMFNSDKEEKEYFKKLNEDYQKLK